MSRGLEAVSYTHLDVYKRQPLPSYANHPRDRFCLFHNVGRRHELQLAQYASERDELSCQKKATTAPLKRLPPLLQRRFYLADHLLRNVDFVEFLR